MTVNHRLMRSLFALLILLETSTLARAQNVGINSTGAAPAASAMLDVNSTTSGMLTPRMTQAQRNAIAAPATGLLIYQTDLQTGFWYFNGTVWLRLCTTPQTYQLYTNAGVSLTVLATWINIPSLSQTITVTEPSRVYVNVGGGIQNTSAVINTSTSIDVVILQNGVLMPNGGYKRVVGANTAGLVTIIENFSMAAIATVAPGTYTFSVAGSKQAGQNGFLFGDNLSVLQGSMSIIVVPQ